MPAGAPRPFGAMRPIANAGESLPTRPRVADRSCRPARAHPTTLRRRRLDSSHGSHRSGPTPRWAVARPFPSLPCHKSTRPERTHNPTESRLALPAVAGDRCQGRRRRRPSLFVLRAGTWHAICARFVRCSVVGAPGDVAGRVPAPTASDQTPAANPTRTDARRAVLSPLQVQFTYAGAPFVQPCSTNAGERPASLHAGDVTVTAHGALEYDRVCSVPAGLLSDASGNRP